MQEEKINKVMVDYPTKQNNTNYSY